MADSQGPQKRRRAQEALGGWPFDTVVWRDGLEFILMLLPEELKPYLEKSSTSIEGLQVHEAIGGGPLDEVAFRTWLETVPEILSDERRSTLASLLATRLARHPEKWPLCTEILRKHKASSEEPPDEAACLDWLEFLLEMFPIGRATLAEVLATRLEQRPEKWWLYIKRARQDLLAWGTLQELIRNRRRWEGPIKEEDEEKWRDALYRLSEWACDVATEFHTKPASPGRDRRDLILRDALIVMTVKWIHDYSGRPYTDDYNEERSACGVVAKRLKGVRSPDKPMEYATVRTIWRKRLKRRIP